MHLIISRSLALLIALFQFSGGSGGGVFRVVAEEPEFEAFVSEKLARTQEAYRNASYACFIATVLAPDGKRFEFMSAELQRTVVMNGKFKLRDYHLFTAPELNAMGIDIVSVAGIPDGAEDHLSHAYIENPDYSSTIIMNPFPNSDSTGREWTAARITERGSKVVGNGGDDLDVVRLFAYGEYTTGKSFSELLKGANSFDVLSWSVEGDRGHLVAEFVGDEGKSRLETVFDLNGGVCLETVVSSPSSTLTCKMSYDNATPAFLRTAVLEGVSNDRSDPSIVKRRFFFERREPEEVSKEVFYLSHYGIAEPKFGHNFSRLFFGLSLILSFAMLFMYFRARKAG